MKNEFGYEASVLLDSVNPLGCRLTTWVLRYPRIIHSELMTHRQFSRSSSSSRAIPIEKMIDQVNKNPVMPIYWGKNKPGMQASEELDDSAKSLAIQKWLLARDYAVDMASELNRIGSHKQISNRLLEPWMWITIIMSTTSHANWFALRDHPAAQPEIAMLARMMKIELGNSSPTKLLEGEWHLPFIMDEDESLGVKDKIMVSVARCARVSYLLHDGTRSIEKDIALYERLTKDRPPHASPLEHAAMSTESIEYFGNFRGFIQHRKMITGECCEDNLML